MNKRKRDKINGPFEIREDGVKGWLVLRSILGVRV